MTIPTIFETCRPRADVLRGAITEAAFAADLAQVIVGKGNEEYLDPIKPVVDRYALSVKLARLYAAPNAATSGSKSLAAKRRVKSFGNLPAATNIASHFRPSSSSAKPRRSSRYRSGAYPEKIRVTIELLE